MWFFHFHRLPSFVTLTLPIKKETRTGTGRKHFKSLKFMSKIIVKSYGRELVVIVSACLAFKKKQVSLVFGCLIMFMEVDLLFPSF